MINTIKEAKSLTDGLSTTAEDLKGYLRDVGNLIDAAADLLSGAEDIEHDGVAGHFVTEFALDELRRCRREVE